MMIYVLPGSCKISKVKVLLTVVISIGVTASAVEGVYQGKSKRSETQYEYSFAL